MGICQYRYNPSELYQRCKPGQGLETCCGAPTYPAVDEPELALVRVYYPRDAAHPESGVDVVDEWRLTGALVPRTHHDPYCPAHGGSPEPPPPAITMAQLEAAHAQYVELAQRFDAQRIGALTQPVPEPAAIAAPVTAEDVQKAADDYASMLGSGVADAGRAE